MHNYYYRHLHVEQQLLTLPEHMHSLPVVSGIPVILRNKPQTPKIKWTRCWQKNKMLEDIYNSSIQSSDSNDEQNEQNAEQNHIHEDTYHSSKQSADANNKQDVENSWSNNCTYSYITFCYKHSYKKTY